MPNSTRYFQLTPDILMEYNYTDIDQKKNQAGNVSGIFDIFENDKSKLKVINNTFNNSLNVYFKDNDKSCVNIYDDKSIKKNFVLPINMSESKFVQLTQNYLPSNMNEVSDWESELDENSSDILVDRFKLHFTSRNYLGDYDGFILRAYVYDEMKNKVCLLSHYIRKTDDLQINKDPMLINQKLYTTYLDFVIPSTNGLLNDVNESLLKNTLFPQYDIMGNSPVVFSIYGVKSEYEYSNFKYCLVEKINTIFVPNSDSFNSVSVTINESKEGDYFEIKPYVSDKISLSTYLCELSNNNPQDYIIMHELSLKEYFVYGENEKKNTVTHRELYLINGVDEDGNINEDELNKTMVYRPIIMNANTVYAEIEDQMKIINTFDNTTIVKSFTGGVSNTHKYGKRIQQIQISTDPAIINVYNKRPDDDIDNLKITNSNSNVKIENHQHSMIGFIESVNVGVSIEQIPRELIDN